ncbi:hypothetical protein CC77DRAFT_834221 [Alternaria alternata]|uniref:Integral membrane protein n=2 Tax=Alternaria alternata complex TaxID=187734 RepID=A0A177DR69_ALTAL|nr:hypothetical protein CC77DRAFT_834221 [Alternaria alternata]RYN28600.1 hypothetical protein AA0115_g5652 [Alternaria tenuissima]KAH6849421.1 hypothetical protein B0T12DRAFT_356547 [Alternaria alternata]OAG21700.1 hypothetical protein CC77DRAFT_834221 [Alternaria alternata]OWY50285.1 integral membrane protein [Alternaria alternata]RYN56763.1 hypothetical protein AA0114_g2817 [Alternaria tenuissima]
MDQGQGEQGRPLASSSTSTTTTSGPHTTTTTTSTTPGHGVTVQHFGPQSTTITHPTVTTMTRTPSAQPSMSDLYAPPSNPAQRVRSSSIRIRRPSHQPSLNTPQATPDPVAAPEPISESDNTWQTGRRRSSSEPRPPPQAMFADDSLRRQLTGPHLQPLYEDGANPSTGNGPPPSRGPSNARRGLTRQSSAFHMRRSQKDPNQNMMGHNLVDVLDVIDPEVSALTTLNNVQNSLFLPNLPWLYNRQPTYDLGQTTSDSSDEEMGTARGAGREEDQLPEMTQQGEVEQAARGGRGTLQRNNTIDSNLSTLEEGEGHHYAVLPHGASLTGWTDEEKAALDDHVRHLLHSRRARFKRTMKGFGRYVRNPLGFLVTLYFFLITFWGAAWVLFLIGWIYVGDRQAYFVEIADQVLTALFCVVGITMFPFRIVDTYHMIWVAKYAHKTWEVRKKRGLQDLKDHNELPTMPRSNAWETGEAEQEGVEAPVLTAEEQKRLEYHQAKLEKSHTFYRPHETYTHHAFSIRLLIAIIVLLDFHSMFQCALGGTTWGIYYKDRPKEVTAIILSFSLTCNITAGIIIGRGDKRSRKKLVVEQILRQEMTEEALKKLRKERGIKAKGLMTKKQKKEVKKELVGPKKNPLDTILHRG